MPLYLRITQKKCAVSLNDSEVILPRIQSREKGHGQQWIQFNSNSKSSLEQENRPTYHGYLE